MIEQPTALILGAGASMPYGFPSGRELITKVCALLRNDPHPACAFLDSTGETPQSRHACALALERSHFSSIDSFLEHRPEYRGMGKCAIAAVLIAEEREDELMRRREEVELYEWLFNRLYVPREMYEANRVCVISFNYDRSLERFLEVAIQNAFGCDQRDATRIRNACPVVHVYGSLGELPMAGRGRFEREYGPTTNAETLKNSVLELRTMHELDPRRGPLRHCKRLLDEAKVICCLGWGYHEDSLRAIGLDQLATGKRIYGTAYGLGSAEAARVKQLLGGEAILGGPKQTCVQFLREQIDLE